MGTATSDVEHQWSCLSYGVMKLNEDRGTVACINFCILAQQLHTRMLAKVADSNSRTITQDVN